MSRYRKSLEKGDRIANSIWVRDLVHLNEGELVTQVTPFINYERRMRRILCFFQEVSKQN